MWGYDLFGFLYAISWLQALCFVFGFALLIYEMFHPGFGVPGISGIILLILGIMFTARNFLDAIIMILIILVIIGIILFFVIRSATKGKLNKKLVLSEKLNKEEGYVGRNEPISFLGKEGIAITMLRPSGIVEVDGVKLDVVTEGEFLPKGTKVKVDKIEGMRIVVTKIPENE